jgi:hypothetical protein
MQEKIGEMLSAGQRFVNLWMFLVTKNEQDVPCDILFRAAQDLLSRRCRPAPCTVVLLWRPFALRTKKAGDRSPASPFLQTASSG